MDIDVNIISEQPSAIFKTYHDQVRFISGMKGWSKIRILTTLINPPR